MNFVIKPEYKERVVSVSGEVGGETAYEDAVHKVINVNKETGSYETEVMGIDAYESIWSEFSEQHIASDLLGGVWESSYTYNMSTELGIARSKTEAIGNDNFPIYTGGIAIEDADKMTQYIRRPKVSIVRIEGELIFIKVILNKNAPLVMDVLIR